MAGADRGRANGRTSEIHAGEKPDPRVRLMNDLINGTGAKVALTEGWEKRPKHLGMEPRSVE